MKKVLIVLAVLVGLVALVLAMAPAEVNVERSLEMEAPKEVVYHQVNELKNWSAWSPWLKKDPDMKLEYGESTQGAGAWYSWTSEVEDVGSGRLDVKESVPFSSITNALDFGDQGTGNGYWKFEETEAGTTKVTWGFHTELAFAERWLAFMMDGFIGPSFEQGLNDMKAVVEKYKDSDISDIETVEVSAMQVYTIIDTITAAQISETYAKHYAALSAHIGMDNLSGMPMGIYHEYSEDKVILECAMPSNIDKAPADGMNKTMTHEGKALKITHKGSYSLLDGPHYAMGAHLMANGQEVAGPVWHVYANDPTQVESEKDIITEIYYPIN